MRPAKTRKAATLSQGDYRLLAEFRYLLRRFLSFSETAARAARTTPRQHQALLAIRGSDGPIATGVLAERLAIRVHSAVELGDRLEAAGLVRRAADKRDRRRMLWSLTPKGERLLEKLSLAHRNELKRLAPLLTAMAEHFQK
jgi:DNA-binding MarR family transcriptional regulator